jgi:cell division transport system permease protein
VKTSYIFREGFAGFRRSVFASISCIITITISLLLISVFFIISAKTSSVVESVRRAVEFEVFLKDSISPEQKTEIEGRISALEEVEKVEYVSKEDAARIFEKEFGENIDAVLDFNPLPPSFKIAVRDEYNTPEKAEALKIKLSEIEGVDQVTYRKDLLEFLDTRAKVLSRVSLVLGILLSAAAVYFVASTVRLTIHDKRKNIHAMELVGASSLFIRMPFFIGGILQGFLGGLLAAVLLYGLTVWGAGFLSYELVGFFTVSIRFYLLVVCAGICMGALGSAVGIRRFSGKSKGK